jgi:hypothetical protein
LKAGNVIVAKADPHQLALEALSLAIVDRAPRVLYGTTKRPGFFADGKATTRQAAEICLAEGWLQGTGQFDGKGKKAKELHCITPAGIRQALTNGEPISLLRSVQGNLHDLAGLKENVLQALESLKTQEELVRILVDRLQPADLQTLLAPVARPTPASAPAAVDMVTGITEYLAEYQRQHPYGHCPLPELFHHVAEPRGLTIGLFHDDLRRLVQERRIRLHPFTGAAYQLQEEKYALVAGQEIKYYAERLAGP